VVVQFVQDFFGKELHSYPPGYWFIKKTLRVKYHVYRI
jgi:hypothetical protein